MRRPSPTLAGLRHDAQQRLRERGPAGDMLAPGGAGQADNPQRLLHELQVHQVELQMQNEQLEAARAMIEATLASYTDLYDFAPVPYLTLDRSGVIAELNLAAARLIGVERARLLDKRLGNYVAVADRRRFAACLQLVFGTQADAHCEMVLITSDGARREVEVRASLAENGKDCRLVMIDVSARRGESRRLALLADVFAQAQEAMFITDVDGIIVDVNHAFCAGTGYAREQALGQHARLLRCERQAPGLGETILRALAIGGSWQGEVAHRHADGSVQVVVEHITSMLDADGARHCVSRFARQPGK